MTEAPGAKIRLKKSNHPLEGVGGGGSNSGPPLSGEFWRNQLEFHEAGYEPFMQEPHQHAEEREGGVSN